MATRNARLEFVAPLVGLTRHVRLVRNNQNRSAPLPTPCDSCASEIEAYPFVTNHGSGHRKYHVTCAVRIGLIGTEGGR